jgi:NADP-dependent 3-hydroxy acid dehydrogenase YdfG
MFISARNPESLQKLKEELESTYQVPVATAVIDVKEEESIKAGVEAAVQAFGRIDIVISNGRYRWWYTIYVLIFPSSWGR